MTNTGTDAGNHNMSKVLSRHISTFWQRCQTSCSELSVGSQLAWDTNYFQRSKPPNDTHQIQFLPLHCCIIHRHSQTPATHQDLKTIQDSFGFIQTGTLIFLSKRKRLLKKISVLKNVIKKTKTDECVVSLLGFLPYIITWLQATAVVIWHYINKTGLN